MPYSWHRSVHSLAVFEAGNKVHSLVHRMTHFPGHCALSSRNALAGVTHVSGLFCYLCTRSVPPVAPFDHAHGSVSVQVHVDDHGADHVNVNVNVNANVNDNVDVDV